MKTAEDLTLPFPDVACREDGQRGPETVTVEPSDEPLAYVRNLGDRATLLRRRAVGPDEDNMLKISTDGRRGALDRRCSACRKRHRTAVHDRNLAQVHQFAYTPAKRSTANRMAASAHPQRPGTAP